MGSDEESTRNPLVIHDPIQVFESSAAPYSVVRCVNLLAALAGVGGRLVTVRSAPAWLAVAHRSLDAIGLADAVHAVNLLAGLTAGDHPGLHLGLCEVLQFIVDVQVLDATVEAGAVLDLPEAESACVHVHGHS